MCAEDKGISTNFASVKKLHTYLKGTSSNRVLVTFYTYFCVKRYMPINPGMILRINIATRKTCSVSKPTY